MSARRSTVILGSTGTIGAQQVEEHARDPDTRVVALAAAGSNADLLAYQAVELGVYGIAVRDGDLTRINASLDEANTRAGTDIRPEVLIGPGTLIEAAAAGADVVVNAVAGTDGIDASIAALDRGSELRVANTESLLALDLLQAHLPAGSGPARVRALNPALAGIQEALATHEATRVVLLTSTRPSGRRRGTRASVNAHTGMDTGIALLELAALTDLPVEVVGHDGPITSMVELAGGGILLNQREPAGVPTTRRVRWSFDPATGGGQALARGAAEEGGTYPLVLHTANTLAVDAHLRGRLPLEEVLGVLARVLERHTPEPITREAVEEACGWTRLQVQMILTGDH